VRWSKKMEDRWLSVDEMGIYLGVKRDTVYKWISEKAMPAHKIGRLWKFKKEEIDEWVRKGGSSDKGCKQSSTLNEK
jgi:excisionase family DNA binding protein